MLRGAFARLRVRRGRGLLAAAGIVAAAAMLGAAVTVSYGLATGFERTAERADLPDVIARFDEERAGRVDERVRRLPNLEAVALRLEIRNVPITGNGRFTEKGVAEVVREGRRGYAIVDGRDLRPRADEAVIERGLASEWDLEVGDRIDVSGLEGVRVVGIAVSPDNVAYPLAAGARFYLSNEGLVDAYGAAGVGFGEPPVNSLLLWARDPALLPVTLTQARAVSYGITDLRFATRAGIQVLIDQAAGIVVALLIAFSLVALASATLMLAASARADVERRLQTIGVMRAVGFSRGGVAGRHAGEAALVAVPAAALGLAIGALIAAGPSARLLGAINQLGPGLALVPLLALCLVGIAGIVCAATAWPAWRAAGMAPAESLRGAELRRGRGRAGGSERGRRLPAPRGAFGLGLRIVAARRVRLVATVAVLAVATAVVLLMLALASLLEQLASDPGTLGKRYALTADPDTASAREIRALPGVAGVAPRYEVEATDSFRLGETLRVIAFPGDHTRFEAPPLAEGRRVRSDREVEIGLGLAQALGLGPGGTLAAQLPSGREARFRVVGVVRALEKDGRVAYTRPRRVLAADPSLEPTLAIRLEPGAEPAAVQRRIAALGAAEGGGGTARATGGASTSNRSFLALLAGLLRAVAVVNGLVCLYALVQSLALTATERRGTVALLRAFGASRGHVALVLAGAAAAVVVLAAPLGVALERLVLSPAVAGLAADYAALPLAADAAAIAVVGVGIVGLAGTATLLVSRRAARESIVSGLREG